MLHAYGVARAVQTYVAHPERFRQAFLEHWNTKTSKKLVSRQEIVLTPLIENTINAFDFKRIHWLDATKLVDDTACNLGRSAGVFADYVTTPAHVLAQIPEGVSDAAAAALPCAGMTAYQALDRKCRISEGDICLIQGVSGGAGGFAVQIAKAKGATVIALAQEHAFERVAGLGADHLLDYTHPDLASQVRAIAQDGVDVFFEVIKAQDVNENFRHIRFNGQFVTTDPLPDLSNVEAYAYGLSIHEVALGGAYAAGDLRSQTELGTMLSELMAMVASGQIDPMIETTCGFAEIPTYLRHLMDRKVDGKIVAIIGGKT